MSTEMVKAEQKAAVSYGSKGVQIDTLEGMYRFAQYVVASGFAPKGLDKPESVLIAIQSGAELGMSPMQSLQCIAIINGRAGIYGDAALALVRGSGLCESYSQVMEGEGDNRKYVVTSKRKDSDTIVTAFSVADAKKAGLWGKQGPWTQYPERMLMFRARGFNLRDNFGDVLKGMRTTEELQDMPAERLEVVNKPKNSIKGAIEAVNADFTVSVQESESVQKQCTSAKTEQPEDPHAQSLQKVKALCDKCTAAKVEAAYTEVGLKFDDDPPLELESVEVLEKLAVALEKRVKKENK